MAAFKTSEVRLIFLDVLFDDDAKMLRRRGLNFDIVWMVWLLKTTAETRSDLVYFWNHMATIITSVMWLKYVRFLHFIDGKVTSAFLLADTSVTSP